MVDFILRSRRKGYIARYKPDVPPVLVELSGLMLLCIFPDAPTFHFLYPFYCFEFNAFLVHDVSIAIRHRNYPGAKLLSLLRCVNCNVAGARDGHLLAVPVDTAFLKHLVYEIDQTVAGSLFSHH
ncbi:hypothetical protein ES703_114926 [subsurface metagenome]